MMVEGISGEMMRAREIERWKSRTEISMKKRDERNIKIDNASVTGNTKKNEI